MSDQSNDKEFEATQQKLLDARKKGELPRSADLNTAASYIGLLVALFFLYESIFADLAIIFSTLMIEAHPPGPMMGTASILSIWRHGLEDIAFSLVGLFIVPAVFVLLSIGGQRSFSMTPSRLTPKLNRISIINGFKNKFGRAGFFEFLKSFVKLVIFSLVLAIFLNDNFDLIGTTTQMSPSGSINTFGQLAIQFLCVIAVIAMTIGAIDFIFQKSEHLRKNRMSFQDLKDELKGAEGDPAMKQNRRQKAMARAANRMADLPKASVVMVNPTHFAVALKWDPAAQRAPTIIAKGVDEVALQIRKIAIDNNVPIFSDPPSTRSLYNVGKVGEPIPRDHFEAVAAAIRFADHLRQSRK